MSSLLHRARVAFLLPDLWAGGGLVFTINLASELMRRGVSCEVFSLRSTNWMEKDCQRLGIPVTCIPGERLILEDRLSAVLEKIQQFHPTAIVAAGMDPLECLRYAPPGVAKIGIEHQAVPQALSETTLYWEDVDMFVGVSDLVCNGLRAALKQTTADIRCIEPGVPFPAKQARQEAILSGEPLRILYLGRLEDHAKRVRIFPAIFKRLQQSGIPFQWIIAGDGPERAYLESQMSSQNPRQEVVFRGLVPYGDVPALLAESDVFLLTSDSEAFCLSLHEAMACGLTPVVSAIPGRVGEIVTPETGLKVPTEPPEGYADAVIWLHHHRAEAVKLGAAARACIGKNHSLEAMGEKWLPLLEPKTDEQPAWPRRWKIKPPRGTQRPSHYSLPMRLLRRLRKHWQ